MKRFLLLATAVLFASCGPRRDGAVGQLHADDPSHVKIEKEHDFGKVAQFRKLNVDFSVRNDLGEELVIKNVSKTCGCTEARIRTFHIKPEENLELTATMETSEKAGPYSSLVRLKAEGKRTGKQVDFEFVLKVDVLTLIRVRPSVIEFGENVLGTSVRRDVDIKQGTAVADWNVLRAESEDLDLALIPTENARWTLTARLKSQTNRIGALRGDVSIYLCNGDQVMHGPILVPFSAFVSSDVSMEPKSLFFGQLTVGHPKVITVKVSSKAGQPFDLVLSDGLKPDLKARIIDESPAIKYVEVSCLSGDNNERAVSGKLSFQISTSGSRYYIDLPYVGYVSTK